jgi:hypothetical protein
MTRRGPTFIIAGAPRSGTTWLYHLLDRHPDVFMARPVRPEPKFFLVDELYARGLQFYVDTWFAGADAYPAAGEKTTNYLESARAAERIHADLPDVRLVFILREPAHRAYSNWAWSRMNGMETEDFETALGLEDERQQTLDPKLRYARPHAYFSRGLYASMLQPYVDRFPAEQLLVVKFDSIVRDPGALAAASPFHRRRAARGDAAGLDVVNPSERMGERSPRRCSSACAGGTRSRTVRWPACWATTSRRGMSREQ